MMHECRGAHGGLSHPPRSHRLFLVRSRHRDRGFFFVDLLRHVLRRVSAPHGPEISPKRPLADRVTQEEGLGALSTAQHDVGRCVVVQVFSQLRSVRLSMTYLAFRASCALAAHNFSSARRSTARAQLPEYPRCSPCSHPFFFPSHFLPLTSLLICPFPLIFFMDHSGDLLHGRTRDFSLFRSVISSQ